MDYTTTFSFPSLSTSPLTASSSPSSTPRKSSHRRSQAVTVPAIATVSLRTPVNYTPPSTYHRASARHHLNKNLASIPEGPSAPSRPIPSASYLSPRPSYYRSTSAESVQTIVSSSSSADSTPDSCRFSYSPPSNYTYTATSTSEPFPRLSVCDEEMGNIVEDDDEFWHCAGLGLVPQTASFSTIAQQQMDAEMKHMEEVDAAVFHKVQAWRDSI